MTTPLDKYARFIGSLSRESLETLPDFVMPDVHFRDPFNEVVGADKMAEIFVHMFDTVGDVRFEILHSALASAPDGDTGMLYWRLHSTLRKKPWSFEGMSRVQFNANGQVVSHFDHWDAAREFYEHFPVIGWALSSIRNKIALAA